MNEILIIFLYVWRVALPHPWPLAVVNYQWNNVATLLSGGRGLNYQWNPQMIWCRTVSRADSLAPSTVQLLCSSVSADQVDWEREVFSDTNTEPGLDNGFSGGDSSLLTPHSWLLVASLSAHPLSPLSTTGRLPTVWQDFPLFLPSIQLHKEPGPVVMLSTSRNFNSFWLPHTYWDYMHSFSEQYTSYLYAITVINCFIIEIKCWRLFW